MKRYMIKNKDELDTWLFHHANTLGHRCVSTKERFYWDAYPVNVKWTDTVTGETIDLQWVESDEPSNVRMSLDNDWMKYSE